MEINDLLLLMSVGEGYRPLSWRGRNIALAHGVDQATAEDRFDLFDLIETRKRAGGEVSLVLHWGCELVVPGKIAPLLREDSGRYEDEVNQWEKTAGWTFVSCMCHSAEKNSAVQKMDYRQDRVVTVECGMPVLEMLNLSTAGELKFPREVQYRLVELSVFTKRGRRLGLSPSKRI